METSFKLEVVELPNDQMHVYKWLSKSKEPEFVFVLIHGLMMNGKSFESMAMQLAAKGSHVVAPDIRGFGQSYFDESQREKSVDYKKSLEDLADLIEALKSEFPSLPIVCVGESLGAHFARSIVSRNKNLVDALILSSPCVRPKMLSASLIPHAINELIKIGQTPNHQIDLKPFAKKFLKSEPENLSNYLNDPLARKSLDLSEIYNSVRIVRTLKLRAISPHIPILVFRGEQDCVCKLNSMEKFIDSLRSKNISFYKLDKCGHLIMQSKNLEPSVMDMLITWCRTKLGHES